MLPERFTHMLHILTIMSVVLIMVAAPNFIKMKPENSFGMDELDEL